MHLMTKIGSSDLSQRQNFKRYKTGHRENIIFVRICDQPDNMQMGNWGYVHPTCIAKSPVHGLLIELKSPEKQDTIFLIARLRKDPPHPHTP